MTSQSIFGVKPVSLASVVPAGLAHRHCRRYLRRSLHSSSTFLRSLRSRPVTALRRYYGRSDSCSCRGSVRGQFPGASPRLLREQVSLIHAFGLPTLPSPTTCGRFVSPRHVTYRRIGPRLHPPTGSSPNGNSGLRHYLAGSPHHTGRIEFVILRTGRSTPVAPHHASRRDLALQRDRSYVRLQATLTRRGLSPLRPNALSGAPGHGF